MNYVTFFAFSPQFFFHVACWVGGLNCFSLRCFGFFLFWIGWECQRFEGVCSIRKEEKNRRKRGPWFVLDQCAWWKGAKRYIWDVEDTSAHRRLGRVLRCRDASLSIPTSSPPTASLSLLSTTSTETHAPSPRTMSSLVSGSVVFGGTVGGNPVGPGASFSAVIGFPGSSGTPPNSDAVWNTSSGGTSYADAYNSPMTSKRFHSSTSLSVGRVIPVLSSGDEGPGPRSAVEDDAFLREALISGLIAPGELGTDVSHNGGGMELTEAEASFILDLKQITGNALPPIVSRMNNNHNHNHLRKKKMSWDHGMP